METGPSFRDASPVIAALADPSLEASGDGSPRWDMLQVDVAETMDRLLEQEDVDRDFKITVDETTGARTFMMRRLPDAAPMAGEGGMKEVHVSGTYQLANLLQELAKARMSGKKEMVISREVLMENPVSRLTKMLIDNWRSLTRTVDEDGIYRVAVDKKARRSKDPHPRVYVPCTDAQGISYFQGLLDKPRWREAGLVITVLPPAISHEYMSELHTMPGILSLALRQDPDRNELVGVPFVVPGGRFNEMYGWDSYFMALGLLACGRVNLAKSMVDNFVYEIEHYGKILNANRTYYLLRTQPPFLTDMAIQCYRHMEHNEESHAWLKSAFVAAIHEYRGVWMSKPRFTPETGLSRYCSEGRGVPPETEARHFDSVVLPYATEANLNIEEYLAAYESGEIVEPELDEYFMHDQAVRESGHDTTYRLSGVAAHLNTIDLQTLLFRYEVDIARAIEEHFGGRLEMPDGSVEVPETWRAAANKRRELCDQYLWDPKMLMYFDYHFVDKMRQDYIGATMFWALWAGMATQEQAAGMVANALPLLEMPGGMVAGTEDSRGPISLLRPNRQWDYPYGWAPHQMMAWEGLVKYGFREEAARLAYRWLFMIVTVFRDFNGTVVEKYDVVACTHKVYAEYGNVGIDFKYVPDEGFGWMNASFLIGVTYLSAEQLEHLKNLTPPEQVFPGAPLVPAQ